MKRVLLAALLVAGAATAGERVRVWEGEVTLETYPLGPDDVNPHFRAIEGSVIYPYTMQDNLTTEKVDRTYRAWFLENEYLKLMCLPEIGGRIQYVHDKRRNEPMFYENHVIKPGLIALRGAWVSGGIEWNRGPEGHTVTSFSPVDVLGVENGDGSASLLIGNIEKIFRTGWQVRLTLHPGRTYLDEEIVLYNPTGETHPYYFWNNTAFPDRPKTRFLFPMSLGMDHEGKNFFSWPIHEGKDLTWLRNYDEPTSIFAYRSVFDFFGAYDADRDYGIVAVSDHRRLPGKKAWTWGRAESGVVSQSVLTDEDGPYIEVQSGPLPTQSDFAPLAPGEEVRWQEFWYPAFGLGEGFEYATRDVVVARIDRDGGSEFRFHATSELASARLRITGVPEKPLRLGPKETVSAFVPGAAGVSLDVSVVRDDGALILSYRSPLEIPKEIPPSPSLGTWMEPPKVAGKFDRMRIPSLAEARRSLASGTLGLVPRAVLALAGEESFPEFASRAKRYLGEDEFEFLEAAFAFAELARIEDAWRILDSGKEDSWLLARYQLAFWSHLLWRESEAQAILRETQGLSSDYVFPSRPESLEALRFAARETPDEKDGKAFLLLGNLLAGLGRIEEAAESWREAARLDPKSSVAHRNLGALAWKKERDLDRAAEHFRLALEARPSDQTLYRDLARVHVERGRPEEAIRVLESMPTAPRRRPDATLDLARAYVSLERYDDAIRLLAETSFSNWEGDSGTWRLYSGAHIGRGERSLSQGRFAEALEDFERALEYPRNLNVGRPARPKEAKALYYRGRALEALGRSREAEESFRRCASGAPLGDEQRDYVGRCSALIPR